jgi:hypothetical protein
MKRTDEARFGLATEALFVGRRVHDFGIAGIALGPWPDRVVGNAFCKSQ